MLSSTTCVGLRYGLPRSLFLEVASPDYHIHRSFSVLSRGFPRFNVQFRLYAPATRLRRFRCGQVREC